MDWHHATPHDVMRAYLLAWRSSPPSMSGRMLDAETRGSSLPTGHREQLARLMVGVGPLALLIVEMRLGSCCADDEHRQPRAMIEHVAVSDPAYQSGYRVEPRAVGLEWAQIGRAVGVTGHQARKLWEEAERVVRENLARCRAALVAGAR